MSRRDWTFDYSAAVIAEGAESRASYHRKRAEYWRGEVDSAKDAIQAKGIDLRSYDVTGGQRHEVVIDPALATRLSEAESKMRDHDRNGDEYEKWSRVLRAAGDKALSLTYDDVLHFDLA